MALHLIKLCVGADTPDDLRDWRASPEGRTRANRVHTRQTPKRAGEIIDGGSLFWVFKGVVLIRQRVLGIETFADEPRKRCEIQLDTPMIRTAPQPRRAFQGWRYLEPKDAPGDLPMGEGNETMSVELARQLRELGAW
jgi:hypothetical protein